MRLDRYRNCSRLLIKDRDGRIPNIQVMLVGGQGSGKSMFTEVITEEFHKHGYLVIVLTDVKDAFEFAYAMFKPKERYHLDLLRKEGKEPEAKGVQIYQPFTFNIPKEKLPEINFFTYPIKSLGREALSLILETKLDKESMRVLLNTINDLKSDEGLFKLIYKINRKVTKKEGLLIKADSDFNLKYGEASRTNIKEITSFFKPFIKDFFLMPENFKYNLDIGKLLKNQKDYHLLNLNFIKDNKLKALNYLLFFDAIYSNRGKCKYPILFVIEEIGNLTPFKSKGYQEFLADYLRPRLKTLRRDSSFILNNQVWHDIDSKIRSYATDYYLGKLEMADMSIIKKVYTYSKDVVYAISRLQRGHFIRIGMENETMNAIRCLLPRHCHAEEGYDFIKMYRKEFPERMVEYSDLLREMKLIQDEEKRQVSLLVKKDRKEEKDYDEKLKKQREKQQQAKEEIKRLKEETKQIKSSEIDEIKNGCVDDYKEGMSLRAIARKYNKSHPTIKKWLEDSGIAIRE